MSGLTVVLVTVLLIAASAFFVAVEFALIAARAHRLEARAEHSAAARAAVRNSHELSLMLAGSQLGITVCTLALGAITKPALDAALGPVAVGVGIPEPVAGVLAFVLALFVVTFLHLVVGEMAPKSWAIAHPELSATLLSLPMRGFMWVFRPLLRALNAVANALVRRAGATPVDTLTVGHDPRSLRALVRASHDAGTLEGGHERSLGAALGLADRRIAELVDPDREVAAVAPDADADALRAVAAASGHLRLLVREGERWTGTVHVRDALAGDASAASLSRPVLELDADVPVHEALLTMQRSSTHLAVVTEGDVQLGIVSIHDIVPSLLPR